MPMEAQTRLLRVLQQGEYTTVGGRTPSRPMCASFAATNKDLRILIQQGLFREDLFFRLNVVPLRLPPLRERIEDVPDLIRHFFTQAEREGLPPKQLDQAALERVKRYRWPGKRPRARKPRPPAGRALSAGDHLGRGGGGGALPARPDAGDRRAARRGGALGRGRAPSGNLFCRLPGGTAAPWALPPHLAGDRVSLLTRDLGATRGNQIRAADLLGVNRNTLRKKIRDLEIQVFPIRRISPD